LKDSVDSLGSAGFVPVMSNGLGGDASLESPEEEESGEGEEEVESGGEEEGSAKADSDSGSMWVCGI
jgi:hypothetical protein